jgi:hypothetical protein
LIRAAFFALGLTLTGCGSALFAVDSVTLTESVAHSKVPVVTWISAEDREGRRVVNPPEWVSFTLVGIGGVTILYALALPRQ